MDVDTAQVLEQENEEVQGSKLTKRQKRAIKALRATEAADAAAGITVNVIEEVDEPSAFVEEEEEQFVEEESAFPPEEDEQDVVANVEEEPVVEQIEEKTQVKKVKAKKAKPVVETPIPAVFTSEDDNFAGALFPFFRRCALANTLHPVETALPNWVHLPLPVPLYRALHELKFLNPTAIQERALSVEIGAMPLVAPPEPEVEEEWGGIGAVVEEEWTGIEAVPEDTKLTKKQLRALALAPPAADKSDEGPQPGAVDRDIVGVAQTGSGKTLAYGLPILSYILSTPAPTLPLSDDAPAYSRLSALILAPTRELALQVRAAIAEVSQRTNRVLPDHLQDVNINAPRKRERGRYVSVVALTGGMSVEKQKRQLSRGADILVATPGRLWDLIGEVRGLFSSIQEQV